MRLKSYLKSGWLREKLKHIADRPCVFTTGEPTVIGFMSAPTGLGNGARLIFNALKDKGYNPNSVDITNLFFENTRLRLPFFCNGKIGSGPLIFHVNAPELLYVIDKLGVDNIKQQKIISVWAWEQPLLPKEWLKAEAFIDEIWASSYFLKSLFQRSVKTPVYYTPYPLVLSIESLATIPQKKASTFKVFTAFDPKSGLERKNPEAAVQAFKRSFENVSSAELTIKVTDPNWPIPKSWHNVKNIKIINSIVSDEDIRSGMKTYDCVISLHRSEGFGFLIATALSNGIPTLFTTGFGSEDFAKSPGAYTVTGSPYHIKSKNAQYQAKHGPWIDPDIIEATGKLKKISKLSLSERHAITAYAREWWLSHYSSDNFIDAIPTNTKSLFS